MLKKKPIKKLLHLHKEFILLVIYHFRDKSKIGNIVFEKGDLSDNHWSLDFPEDVEFIKSFS